MEIGAGGEFAQVGNQPKIGRESSRFVEEGKQLSKIAMDRVSILKERGHKNGHNSKTWQIFACSIVL
jgi:hypothetical protein